MNFAYLSGYIDGDGCISCRTYITKKMHKIYKSSLEIASVSKEMCEYFFYEFGGSFSKRPEKRNNRKDTWAWSVSGNPCKKILELCLPHLILKHTSSYLCCQLIKEVTNTRCYANKKVSEESHTKRIQLIQKIKEEIHINNKVNQENFHLLKKIKKSIEPSCFDFAYIAGLIDAEGCFRIKNWQPKRQGRNRSYVITLEIGNTKFPIFPWIIQRFGGSVFYRKPVTQKNNSMIIWTLSSDALYQFAKNVFPFLKFKKERCEKLIHFHETNFAKGGDRHSSEFQNHICNILITKKILYDEFQVLNKRGKH